ncbi:MAG TPA: DUF1080 domain-containing protein [Prolixibacteraceae bacterium]|nr:DUF1080 domain-containing protein [Prolixibacteraceae bacterium]
MRQLTILLLFICFSVDGFSNSGDPKKTGWKPLFGTDLSQAKYDKNCWTMENDVFTASEDKVIWAVGDYENFSLDLEFKTAVGTNSGIIVYCTNPENWIPNSVEIQIADDYCEKWGTASKDWQCGAIFGHLAANQQKIVKKPGGWNKMGVTCKGKIIEVVLNGKKITAMDMSKWTSGKLNPDGSEIPSWLPKPFAELPTKGMIGLQGKHADATIWFRNVRIKQL